MNWLYCAVIVVGLIVKSTFTEASSQSIGGRLRSIALWRNEDQIATNEVYSQFTFSRSGGPWVANADLRAGVDIDEGTRLTPNELWIGFERRNFSANIGWRIFDQSVQRSLPIADYMNSRDFSFADSNWLKSGELGFSLKKSFSFASFEFSYLPFPTMPYLANSSLFLKHQRPVMVENDGSVWSQPYSLLPQFFLSAKTSFWSTDLNFFSSRAYAKSWILLYSDPVQKKTNPLQFTAASTMEETVGFSTVKSMNAWQLRWESLAQRAGFVPSIISSNEVLLNSTEEYENPIYRNSTGVEYHWSLGHFSSETWFEWSSSIDMDGNKKVYGTELFPAQHFAVGQKILFNDLRMTELELRVIRASDTAGGVFDIRLQRTFTDSLLIGSSLNIVYGQWREETWLNQIGQQVGANIFLEWAF
ncbi:MAG: hypothetical protein ACOYOK_07195 [Pseudobdellovibrionaceae bacterium]